MSSNAIFLDRDNTLIHDPGYINHPSQVELLPCAAQALVELKKIGYKLVVVSNQSAVARGIVTEETLAQIHERLKTLLAKENAYLDAIYYCPYHVQGVIEKYRKESDCRKPNPGMLLKAAKDLDIDLNNSWMIGDKPKDIAAGKNAGCKTILLESISHTYPNDPETQKANHKAVNMKEAANIIKQYQRSNQTQPLHPKPQQQETNNQPQPKLPVEIIIPPAVKTDNNQQTNQLLHEILEQLKFNQRTNMFDEFSVMRMLAGITQMAALSGFGLAVYLATKEGRNINGILLYLSFAIFLQVMALTFYIMNERK